MKQLVAVAMSGGIDSLAAAYLLKKQGHSIVGIHFVTGFEEKSPLSRCALNGIAIMAEQIGIDFKILNLSKQFKINVVDFFTRTYLAGKTPNPCLVCNPSIKFGALLEFAQSIGASSLATGHYARIKKSADGRLHLLKGVDQTKDQSYFLARLTQKQLSAALFPLGNMLKQQVVKLTRENRLTPVVRKESQDICFIGDASCYGDFISGQAGFKPQPGLIEDIDGNIIGDHQGLHLFTIGQRRGINCPARQPYYVVRIDTEKNRLVVGHQKDLYSLKAKVVDINWINRFPLSLLRVHARIRARHAPVPATLLPTGRHAAVINFDKPQLAVTPGQGAVFYQDDEVAGSGWIDGWHEQTRPE